jgi:hypothetical protein
MVKDYKVKKEEAEHRLKGRSRFRLILLSQQEAERYRRWAARLARIAGEN